MAVSFNIVFTIMLSSEDDEFIRLARRRETNVPKRNKSIGR